MSTGGVAFTAPDDGDMRADPSARRQASARFGIAADWATVDQVHGSRAVFVTGPGGAGPADGIVTTTPGLPAAVFTADCLGVVLSGAGAVGVAHAGWRGLAAGVVECTLELMHEVDGPPRRAHVGPAIGPCCFEVGPDVAELFSDHVSVTSWGSTSVDLPGAALDRLRGLETTVETRCTACGGGPSHRREATSQRMAAIGWVP
jgi:YfiH family protein